MNLPPPQAAGSRAADAAVRQLAGSLRSIPGIERFGRLTLGELDSAGPRPLQNLWRAARDRLDARSDQVTIGEILDRYAGGDARPGPGAGA